MSITESLYVSLFCIGLVFFVLSSLFALVKILSKVLSIIGDKKTGIPVTSTKVVALTEKDGDTDANAFSTGEPKLSGVDEKTAAMIMAIVSYESKIPLSELFFKSIKAIEES